MAFGGFFSLKVILPLVSAFALAWYFLPRAGPSFREDLVDHAHVLCNLLGLTEPARHVSFGTMPAAPRESNGTIAEVQGWVDRQTFQEKYLLKEPVVFRGAATRQNGFDLECLSGEFEVVMQRELGESLYRVFRDQYDDGSAEFMTFAQYSALANASRANTSAKTPYARAFHASKFKNCKAMVPEDTLWSYHNNWAPKSKKLGDVLVFLGLSENTNSKVHMDMTDSFFTQVHGRKRWLFVEPQYATQLKVYADILNLVYLAGFDFFRESVPANVPIKEVVLHPGDVLYFPAMAFHGVQNLDRYTLGLDEGLTDMLGSFSRHWFFTTATLLNPRLAYKSIEQLWNTGDIDGYKLFFDEFSANSRRKKVDSLAAEL